MLPPDEDWDEIPTTPTTPPIAVEKRNRLRRLKTLVQSTSSN